MRTVAVAARTMDRHARYRSLLPVREYALLSALDCPTLARLAKTRPVEVIIFDLQKPAMPAEEWLAALGRDPELKSLATVWVGQDVQLGTMERIAGLGNNLTIPARPDSQTLIEALTRALALAADFRGRINKPGSSGLPEWRPEGDIIDQALSIFDQPLPDGEPAPTGKQQEWLVSEVTAAPVAEAATESGESPESVAGAPVEEESIAANVEEIGTGVFAVTLEPPPDASQSGALINERFLSTTTHPGSKEKQGPDEVTIERVTKEVVAELADRLATELVSRIDPAFVRRLVEEKFAGRRAPSSPTT